MGYSVELLFDEKSEKIIIEYWKILHESNSGSFMYLKGGKPHISLAVYNNEMEHIDKLKEIVVNIFQNMKKFKINLSSIGVFPGKEMVTFLNPKPSPKLLHVQSTLYSEIRKHKIKKFYWGHYKPRIWVPHCTMIVNETSDKHTTGLEILGRIYEPMEVTVAKVAIAEFFPYKCILEMELL
jgi:2'-5' RNA ligase